jgi:hypothetical protein
MENLIHETLREPMAAIGYTVSRRLAALFPDRAILEGDACSFGLEEFAAGGQCTLALQPEVHARIMTAWAGAGRSLQQHAENACFSVSWQGHSLDVLLLSWADSFMGKARYYWIVAESTEVAEHFYQTCCDWCAEVRGEVLVFDGGAWYKSQDLFQAIQDATFDNLILQGSLKEEVQADLMRFLDSRATYERYRIPWKRGILFIGPPGNGKTHTVKALINAMQRPCLYVKSFQAEHRTEHDCIRDVFKRARQTTPCILVLEDLDSLLDDDNRSFFLNELDGFATNTGIVTLATTNHPERLDPAILERPSRFDRKYHFELPGQDERMAYLTLWNDAQDPALRLSAPGLAQIVGLTEEFSFAYLKELFLSSMVQWIADAKEGQMDGLMASQVATLREQMRSGGEVFADEFVNDDADAVELRGTYAKISRMRRRRGY